MKLISNISFQNSSRQLKNIESYLKSLKFSHISIYSMFNCSPCWQLHDEMYVSVQFTVKPQYKDHHLDKCIKVLVLTAHIHNKWFLSEYGTCCLYTFTYATRTNNFFKTMCSLLLKYRVKMILGKSKSIFCEWMHLEQ